MTPSEVYVICAPAPPYSGGLLVGSIGAFFDREVAQAGADFLTEYEGEHHWVVSLVTFVEPLPDSGRSASHRHRQMSFPEEWSRPRGQSEWGVDLSLETARRWG